MLGPNEHTLDCLVTWLLMLSSFGPRWFLDGRPNSFSREQQPTNCNLFQNMQHAFKWLHGSQLLQHHRIEVNTKKLLHCKTLYGRPVAFWVLDAGCCYRKLGLYNGVDLIQCCTSVKVYYEWQASLLALFGSM